MTHVIRLLTAPEAEARRAALVDLLIDAVEDGASVNFVRPMTPGCLSRRSRSARAMRAMAGSTPSSVFLRAYWTRSH